MTDHVDNEPIIVIVKNDRYDMYGHTPITARDLWLSHILKEMGGVNESVTAGTYHFNAEQLTLTEIKVTLEPIPEF